MAAAGTQFTVPPKLDGADGTDGSPKGTDDSAAAGLAARARGCGNKVLFTQFLKNGRSGELEALRRLGVEIPEGKLCEKFLAFMSEGEKARAVADQREAFLQMKEKVHTGDYNLLVLDEVLDIVELGILDQEELLEFLRDRPEKLEAVLTGHTIFPELLEAADYVSEVRKVKHPYDRGVKARRGVEW
jgi:cob(I)alamin adenosyltransferase